MLRKIVFFMLFVFFVTSLCAQNVDDIVASYVTARGGMDKIKAVTTERVTGTISLGPDAESTFVLERKRPLKLRMEITVNGQTLIRTFNGKSTGWTYNPFAGSGVKPMTDEEIQGVMEEADFDGPFIDYKAKGNQIVFVDKEEILGKPAYKLKLTNKNGDISYFYFDTATSLLLKWEGTRKIDDQDVPWESYFHDFREVGGVKYPFLIESDGPGTNKSQRITAQKIEANIPLDDSRFEKPNPPPAPTSPEAPPAESPKPN
jgi:outer membrane lipoprotein-sorting protein